MLTQQDALSSWSKRAKGIILVVVIAIIAQFLGGLFPLIGGILFAIIIGIILKNTVGIKPTFDAGLSFVIKDLLKLAVIFLGASLNLNAIIKVGQQSLLVVLVSVILGIGLTFWFGKLLKLDRTLTLMIGVGSSICGATAISCVKGVLEAKDDETAYAISTIVFFNLIAFFVYPVVGHLFQLDDLSFGIWTGTAVHDTSSAVAVGFAYSNEAGEIATTVKLARTLFLLPVIIILPFLMSNRKKGSVKQSLKEAFPWFIVWFLVMSILNSIGWIPLNVQELSSNLAKFLIIMVMAAVGMQVNLKGFAKIGIKPFLTGLFASITVSLISLLMICLIK
ncbi:putative sulfate exporter family transporter [Robertmurraya yapensis]|uniref:Sulfate exporter family transporter n=2 Tax=Bacillaceae TaxID=186817 RepID=A0ACC6S5W5_9BACI|nr:putative sulfate exporter family transporter [Bacillus yapensis]RTR28729.1 putative sulfate exporter family transporter [Bacillus yapensis]TKS94586.1 putative sulfate exporter family transporter [Bacillus yapensis]